MDENNKLILQEMIQANNVVNQTENIRDLKHSEILKENINKLLALMQTITNPIDLHIEAMIECNFLFTYYTDIYNKVRKSEINIEILFTFLNVLKKIEDGEVDQHEGSFEIGTLLKKIYVDSALKRAKKLDDENASKQVLFEPKPINWRDYKKLG